MKKFNVTGVCIPELHYMADTSAKLKEVIKLVEEKSYFIINRPRQYGKTTLLHLLRLELEKNQEYIIINLSFEGIGDTIFENEENFSKSFLEMLSEKIKNNDLIKYLDEQKDKVNSIKLLSKSITQFIIKAQKKVILFIDEIDKSSNNQLFISFLGMLRNKYLDRIQEGYDTFYSVILAGIHDVKTLKLKIRPDEERKYNSPWNIATDFKVDMSFNPKETEYMLRDYSKEKSVKMNISELSEKLFYYTSGYPFLVSRLCKIIDEDLLPNKDDKTWNTYDLEDAVNIILQESNTNFDDLIKNLENNDELYNKVHEIIIGGFSANFNIDNPIIKSGVTYGIFSRESGNLKIHNRIYEQRIYNYMSSKYETIEMADYNYKDEFIERQTLNLKKVLLKFQQFIKENYSEKDKKFIEREGRLLFLSFIKPLINGEGYDFKEVTISNERRIDIVITFRNKRYVVELKIWRGEKVHQKGLKQLSDYLDNYSLKQGYLLIYDFTKEKKYKSQNILFDNKNIFVVYI